MANMSGPVVTQDVRRTRPMHDVQNPARRYVRKLYAEEVRDLGLPNRASLHIQSFTLPMTTKTSSSNQKPIDRCVNRVVRAVHKNHEVTSANHEARLSLVKRKKSC